MSHHHNTIFSEVPKDGLGRRGVILASFGCIGLGAIIGIGMMYYSYLKNKFAEHYALHASITQEIKQLGDDIEMIRSNNPKSAYSLPVKSNQHKKNANVGTGSEDGTDEDAKTTAEPESESEVTGTDTKTRKTVMVRDETVAANPETVFFIEVDELLDGNSITQHDAYSKLKIQQQRLRNSFGFWWRLAKATHLEAQAAKTNGDNELRKTLAYAAFSCAEKSLKLNNQCADAHKWYAITIGSKGDFLSTSDKIKNGFIFKEHIDIAVTLNPQDSTLYHLLGRFCYEVSQLSWVERKLASTLFSTPPTATLSEAIENFLAAEKKGKPSKENRLYLAKCYIGLSENSKAAKWLHQASIVPVLSTGDKLAQEEINKLMGKYRKYL